MIVFKVNDRIEDFLVVEGKKEDIPVMTRKVVAALANYAEKVSIKKAYYIEYEKKWYPMELSPSKYFGEKEIADEILSITKEMKMFERLQSSISIEEFNKNVLLLKNKILGGIEG